MNTLQTIAKVRAELKTGKVVVQDVKSLCIDAESLYRACEELRRQNAVLKAQPAKPQPQPESEG
jgi:hypothetical protein